MSTIRIAMFTIAAGLCAACVPPPGAGDAAGDRSALSSANPWWMEPAGQEQASGETADPPAGTCCLTDECFENLGQALCESSGGVFLGPGVSCEYCTLGFDLLTYLKATDSDRDGRSDFDELEQGSDPHDPHDGPDIDGDGVDNANDRDVDGDRIPNAYDRDIDGDDVVNELDNDRDGDGVDNKEDEDDDGDGVADKKDDDDDADGEDDGDGGGDDDDDDEATSQPAEEPEDEDWVLALGRRWFDEKASDDDPEPADLVEKADDLLDEAEQNPDDFDPLEFARRFFEGAIDQDLTREERAAREEEALAFFRKMFDEDGDGVLDPKDADPNGNGSDDDDHDGVPDQQELRDGTDLLSADSDGDGLSDGDEKKLGTNPNSSDSDGDGLSDLQETNIGTDPTDSDSDDDGLPDGDDSAPRGDQPE